MLEKRGIIEGFYGIPWSFKERISMIRFLSAIDMNQYVYAPKDDPYHNIKWREPYPEDKLTELSKLSNLAREKGVDFVWAIHPGQNLIDFNLYEEEIEKLFAKYDSLNEAGVTSFALCMDDIDRDLAYEQRDFHLKLVKDILKKLENYENRKLLFVHPWYNSAWVDEKGEEYFKLFRNLDDLEIMWTGYDVVAPITKSSQERFTELSQKEANIWFNWPVNDYLRDRIFMEVFEFYDSSEISYKSILSNPMNQAELSKISIYQIGEFAKNPASFVPIESFKRALAYVDKEVASELLIIADSFFASGVYDKFEAKKYKEDGDIALAYRKKDFEKVKSLLDRKIGAIDSYFNNYTNDKLYEEVKAFFTSLAYLSKAVKAAIDKDFKRASNLYEKCGECKVKIYKEFRPDTREDRTVKTSRVLDKIYRELTEELS